MKHVFSAILQAKKESPCRLSFLELLPDEHLLIAVKPDGPMPYGMIMIGFDRQLELEEVVLPFVDITNGRSTLEIDLDQIADLKILHTGNVLGELLSAKQLKHFSPLVGFIMKHVFSAICRQKREPV